MLEPATEQLIENVRVYEQHWMRDEVISGESGEMNCLGEVWLNNERYLHVEWRKLQEYIFAEIEVVYDCYARRTDLKKACRTAREAAERSTCWL